MCDTTLILTTLRTYIFYIIDHIKKNSRAHDYKQAYENWTDES